MTAELVAEEGPLKGLILAFEGKETWVVGRDPDICDLIIEDAKVSRKHFSIRFNGQNYFIENLSESNPIKVNNQSIFGERLLEDGDRVLAGSNAFRFYKEGLVPTFGKEEGEGEEAEVFETSEKNQDTIFGAEESSLPPMQIDLTGSTRFILKVVSGPNAGGEFSLEMDRSYLLGTDTTTCDIIFFDLSVSREHARLSINKDGILTIEDLNSRNGVLVDREKISGKQTFSSNSVVTLGTSSFIVIDQEAPSQTIATPAFEPSEPLPKEEMAEAKAPFEAALLAEEKEKKPSFEKKITSGTSFIIAIFTAFALLCFFGIYSLFHTKEVHLVKKDYNVEIAQALEPFPAVEYTFNPTTMRLFLVGHVSTAVQKEELLYLLQGLTFIKGIDDYVVVDESVWQEMNLLMSKIPELQGVTIFSFYPGCFTLIGHLKTLAQASLLRDFINLNFAYLDRLENRVVVEEEILDKTEGRLIQEGFAGVTAAFSNGELVLTGYISSNLTHAFQVLVNEFGQIQGIRAVRNYVVALSPEQAVVDLNEKYPGRYQVTGYSKHGDVNINVLINCRILMRGDTLDGMTITSIQPHTIFLEKDGLKYKIEYNK